MIKYQEIPCDNFEQLVPTIAVHMTDSDNELGTADDPLKLRLGWILPSGTRVLLFIGKIKQYLAELPPESIEGELLQTALESDLGRENFAQALFSAAKKYRAARP